MDASVVCHDLHDRGQPGHQRIPRTEKKRDRMTPEWRTTTVLALCRRMLDTRQFDALPILADALQDAGCSNEKLLAQCRELETKPVLAERLVNLVYSDETAAAV